jgi:nucleoside 2-deoxyribosyltransferase
MDSTPPLPLLVGEIFVDVTLTARDSENKMRLGGITHAARGFWALGKPFAAAVFLPGYLESSARVYLASLGCKHLVVLGHVSGAPNVVLISDPTEVDDQKYEILLRDEKSILPASGIDLSTITPIHHALVFPGSYDLAQALQLLPASTELHIDVAYDVTEVGNLSGLPQKITTVFVSTSSPLFQQTAASGIEAVAGNFAGAHADTIVLKENRGGCRLHAYSTGQTYEIPAQLGTTVNSVGVGDVFDAAYVTHLEKGSVEAVWRAAWTSSAYSQTTHPDIFQGYVRGSEMLTLEELQNLGGTVVPWEWRETQHIYLAAPDFRDADRRAIERALSALQYHNFNVRRPVVENGEVPPGAEFFDINATYSKDVELLKRCQLVFAVPTGRDPGTLVEIGLAIASGIPVVVYDPEGECNNTMVVAGAKCYSRDLDACLNATFISLSELRSESQ